MTHEEILALRDDLRAKGYDARVAYGGTFDIQQESQVHFLNSAEAVALRDAHQRLITLHGQAAPQIRLADFAEWGGLNYWYDRLGEIAREPLHMLD